MSFNAIRENKMLTKISEFTVHLVWKEILIYEIYYSIIKYTAMKCESTTWQYKHALVETWINDKALKYMLKKLVWANICIKYWYRHGINTNIH